MERLKLGDPLDSETQMGPQADRKQAENIVKYLELGNKEGTALTGGRPATDAGENYIQPTIFTGLADSSRLNIEEIFGPVLVLHEFETEEEAVRRANDTECQPNIHSAYVVLNVLTPILDGLYASVFTRDINRALRVARGLESGNVGVNMSSPEGPYELPFGGVKASGIGRQKGSDAILDWTEVKSVYIRHG